MILVTGATGHLGNVLVRELVARDEKVRVLIKPGETMNSLEGMLVEVIVGDVLNRNILFKAMQDVEYVYHLAGVIAIRPGMEEIMQKVNTEGARNVAETAFKCKVKRMIHVSSVHAFRREPHGITIDEKTPLALDGRIGSYDRTKAEGTRAVLDFVEKGLDAVIVCPSGIIGSHDYFGSELGKTLASFMKSRINFLVDGAYDFVDVRDVAQGLIQAREKGVCGEIYILSGTRITVEDLHQITQNAAGVRSPRFKVPIRLAIFAATIIQSLFNKLKLHTAFTVYTLQTLVDNSTFSFLKASRDLGYKPRPLIEAVADFLTWYNLQQKAISKKTLKKKRHAAPVK